MHRLPFVSISLLVLSGLAFVQGCGSSEEEVSTAPAHEADTPPIVVASNYPLAYFAERIGGDVVDVQFYAKGSGDPAYWQPMPEQIAAMQEADLILVNGATYEKWLDRVSLPSSSVVDTSAAFADSFIQAEDAVTHSHGPEGEHTHTGTAATTWLDMTLAAEQAQAIGDALAGRWPEHAERFASNTQALLRDLTALDEATRNVLAINPKMPVLFSHPVYQYFQRRYGVNGLSLHWEPNEIPDDAQWAHLDELLTAHPAKAMIWEGEPMDEAVEKLQSRGIASVTFDPCGDAPDEGDFVSAMEANLAALLEVYRPEVPRP